MNRNPEIPQVACFGTAFHRTNPDLAARFGLPEKLHQAGARRYGFHGLSCEYIASVLPRFDTKAASGRTVVLHLGNGASMCALDAGRSIASTMAFTAVDGLPMGTRSGSLDPGVILYLMNNCDMDSRAIEHLIYNESGLLGVSSLSSNMRTLLSSGDTRAKLAIDLSVIAFGGSSARLPPLWAVWTGSCSPAVLVKTRRKFGNGCAAMPRGSVSSSTQTRTPRAARGSVVMGPQSRLGPFPRMRS